jgi:methylisocitrate lyase
MHLEDQVMPKKCGHLAGKHLVTIEEMMQKIVAARGARTGDLLLIARTDSRAVEGMEGAIERAKAYLKAGAEVIFPEALENLDEFSEFARKVDAPLLANMTEFGKTPYLDAAQFHRMGYKIVIFPATAFRVMLKAISEAYQELLARGTQRGLLDRMMSREEIYDLLDYYTQENLGQSIAHTVADILSRRNPES